MNSRFLLCMPVLGLQIIAGPLPEFGELTFSAPPVPPPIERRDAAPAEGHLHSAATVHSIGDPTPEEQLYIEFINRSRANPVAEAQIFVNTTDPATISSLDFFNVDTALLQQQFATNPPVPPVAPNAQLIAAARRHTGDMLTNSFQAHSGSDGSLFDQRIRDTGYNFRTVGENVYANAQSVFHGHAGFDVDWGDPAFGSTVGGMQSPPGHRNTIHSADFREVGVGVLFGNNTPAPGSTIPGRRTVGPQLVTQEFGTRQGATPIITGVAYFDLNGNNFYDIGEGIGGIQVSASGTATTAITARSGGYALPVSGNGTYTLTFSGTGMTAQTREAVVTLSQNVKVDLRPTYTPPTVSGPAEPSVNQPNAYQISAVPAATTYQWRRFQLSAPAVEGAETGSGNVTIEKAGTYDVIQSATKKSGSYAFQLAHPVPQAQRVTLNSSFKVNAGGTLRFASRLGWATPDQYAKVFVTKNQGGTWEEVYSQAGTGGAGETGFQDRSISLAAFAGQTIQVRFSYAPVGSPFTYFNQTDFETGWFIDDIAIENASVIGNEQVTETATTAFTFQPAAIADYVLQARALVGHDFLPWGPDLAVRSKEGTVAPTLQFSGVRVTNGQIELDVDAVSGAVPATLAVETKSTLDSAWADAQIAGTETVSPTRVRVRIAGNGSTTAFYRVRIP